MAYWPAVSQENKRGLHLLKKETRRPIVRIMNDIIARYLSGEIKEASKMKVTEIEVMVSKKKSVNYNSWCVAYTSRAMLDENDPDHLEALVALKDQLTAKVAEALNGKPNGNGHGNGQIAAGEEGEEAETKLQEDGHE